MYHDKTFQLNTNIQSLRPSATLATNERSAALATQGKKVFRLGFGQSPFPVSTSVIASASETYTSIGASIQYAAFGRPSYELTARLSFVDFDRERLLNILEQQPKQIFNSIFLEKHCPNIVEAMLELKQW